MLASRPAICGLNWVRVKTRLQHKSALQTPKDAGPETVAPAQSEMMPLASFPPSLLAHHGDDSSQRYASNWDSRLRGNDVLTPKAYAESIETPFKVFKKLFLITFARTRPTPGPLPDPRPFRTCPADAHRLPGPGERPRDWCRARLLPANLPGGRSY